MEKEDEFLALSRARREELDNYNIETAFFERIGDLKLTETNVLTSVCEETKYIGELPF